jgi:hypothetical protein
MGRAGFEPATLGLRVSSTRMHGHTPPATPLARSYAAAITGGVVAGVGDVVYGIVGFIIIGIAFRLAVEHAA